MRKFILVLFFAPAIVFTQDTLSVLSWNIFQRPSILSDQQKQRITPTIEYLKASDCDVLVLQEAFHKKTRMQLIDKLKQVYPHYIGPGKGGLFKINSGVMVFSKYKLNDVKQKVFKRSSGMDSRAKKSVFSASLQIDTMKIQILATHLQAEEGIKKNLIRRAQMQDITSLKDTSSHLIIMAGDFNTDRKSQEYDKMLNILNAENDSLSTQIKYSSSIGNNKLFKNDIAKWIDYILIDGKPGIQFVSTTIEIPFYQEKGEQWHISDHNPIRSKILIED